MIPWHGLMLWGRLNRDFLCEYFGKRLGSTTLTFLNYLLIVFGELSDCLQILVYFTELRTEARRVLLRVIGFSMDDNFKRLLRLIS